MLSQSLKNQARSRNAAKVLKFGSKVCLKVDSKSIVASSIT